MTPPADPPKLLALRHDFPDWQIEYARDVDGYIAVSYPAQNSSHIIAARDLDELREKLGKAEGRRG